LTNDYAIKNSFPCFIILRLLSNNSYRQKKMHPSSKSHSTMEMAHRRVSQNHLVQLASALLQINSIIPIE
jgi:hypothetical protein